MPTMRAVRGYEEKNPEITRHMTSGYPRFVQHPFLHRLAAHLGQRHALGGYTLWLVSSAHMGDRLAAYLDTSHVVRVDDGVVYGVAHPDSPELSQRAKTFLQHTGGFLSSRAAEDRLVHHHILAAVEPEKLFNGNALAEVRAHLAPMFAGVAPEQIYLTNCGMNAMDAAFRAISTLQAARGRTKWIQLGWLYLDTIALLKKFSTSPGDYLYAPNVFDAVALEKLFNEHPGQIAGIVAEVPSNPLVQTADLEGLSALARRNGALIVLDPSVSSSANVDVLPYADVVVSSLTKYFANEGDLTAGLIVVNPKCGDAEPLAPLLQSHIEPLYARDLARLAVEIRATSAVLTQIHENVPQVVAFLEAHPGVKEVYWAQHAWSRDNYRKVARSENAVGSMITFTLRGSLETFYDRLSLPKGPSFGMKTTLICPFMYLAHYDLVTTPAGCAELAASGLDPDLLRLSVGIEPAEEIIGALAEALS
jgi:cystathionine gamma-synthase